MTSDQLNILRLAFEAGCKTAGCEGKAAFVVFVPVDRATGRVRVLTGGYPTPTEILESYLRTGTPPGGGTGVR